MTTPPPDDSGWSDPTAARPPQASEGVSLDKPAGDEPAAPFDPYRFGAPTHPVPPEYAPPGYVPPVPQPQAPPPDQPAGQPYPYPGYSPYPGQPGAPGQPYPGQPYPGQPYPGQPGAPGQPGQGYPYPPPQYLTQYPQPATGNGKATAGLVLGILSIVLFWTTIFDAIPVILGVIFGFLGLNQAKHTGRSRGVAIAGIICGFVGAVLAIIFTVWIIHRIQPCVNSYNSGSAEFNSCVRHHL
jgi:hypothetical protein